MREQILITFRSSSIIAPSTFAIARFIPHKILGPIYQITLSGEPLCCRNLITFIPIP
jgi:hypothetical protein